ncbi:LutC/YkgG family protein [Aneurinibacillus uraniidurans]|uniref:LutC/YkgG family protein n=1 Tax=Aneurinibacillus uraniidurans TaxID=2966586 RepID=UPI0023497316|nr:lactate utilization protein C [Aneurinibacillus sp. B1]WCN37163.1 lactate utilization protein C [Aneurinibacillus sp. B1]
MSTQEREAFLNRLADRLGRPRRSGVRMPEWNDKPYTHLYAGMDQAALVEQFIGNLQELRTEVTRVRPEEAGKALAAVLKQWDVQDALGWDDERLNQLGLHQALEEAGMNYKTWRTEEDADELRAYAAETDVGIVYADLGLCETGTVLLWNGAGRGRMVSLLPPRLVLVLAEDTLLPRLTHAAAYIHERVPGGIPACLNFITGPSRTGDIEMDLVFGVHGPGSVHVILLQK